MARRLAREAAMSLLYQRIFSERYDIDELKGMVDNELELDERDISYIEDIIEGCSRNMEKIDNIIRRNSKGWKFERISKVDLSILRLALYEILYRDDIPESVSINEAVELAKKYGGEKTGSFINGILGSFIRSGKVSP
ncbi:MAG: transcription antitermination factor NusB [Caldicoprobacterales bacterium]|jgi:N utilization substance protein B|nr:transcription antitermination factor NusB [Clostridiales bacterium]